MKKATPKEKLKELIVYISARCADDPSFGKTKLNKILFFADFFYYAKTRKSISEQDYIHLAYGPVPKEMNFTTSEMDKKDIAFAVSQSGPFRQIRIVALRDPNLAIFDPAMISHLDSIIDQVCFKKQLRATWLSDISHDFIGWLATSEGEEIPYQTVYLKYKGGQKVTERDKQKGAELARIFQGRYDFAS